MKACYSELVLYSSLQSRCHRCQLPLCTLAAAETCTWRDLHLELECQILAEKRQVQVQNDHDDFEKDEPHPLYQCILPLRCLLIKESRPEHWAAIQVSIQSYSSIKSKCISRKSGLMPCLKTILKCFALEHSAFKTKHLKMSLDMAQDSIFLKIIFE